MRPRRRRWPCQWRRSGSGCVENWSAKRRRRRWRRLDVLPWRDASYWNVDYGTVMAPRAPLDPCWTVSAADAVGAFHCFHCCPLSLAPAGQLHQLHYPLLLLPHVDPCRWGPGSSPGHRWHSAMSRNCYRYRRHDRSTCDSVPDWRSVDRAQWNS